MTLVVVGDIETTGLEWTEGHRIVEVALFGYHLETRRHLIPFLRRVNPERSIAAAATAIHGIVNADVAGAPKWEATAPLVAKILAKADFFVAHNGNGFDVPFLNHELQRVGHHPIGCPVIDTMEATWATPMGKKPTLKELCFALDVAYDDAAAHAADYDVKVLAECLFRGLDWGWLNLPAAPAMLEARMAA